MTTLTLEDSDHAHFHKGSQALAVVERGRLVQLASYQVRNIERAGALVVITTALEYQFIARYADYEQLLGLHHYATDRVPA
jgi:hypothetical protein